MKTIINLILLFHLIICLVSNLHSQQLWTIKAGVNLSAFQKQDTDAILNSTFGFERTIVSENDIKLNIGILFSRQGGLLKNKPVKTDDSNDYLYSYNFKAVLGNVEFPILIEYQFNKKTIKTSIYTGFSFKFGMADKSEKYNKKLIYDIDHPERKMEFRNYKFELVQGDYDNSFVRTTGWVYNIGLKNTIYIFEIDVRYSNALHGFGQFNQIHPIMKRIHSLHLLLGIKL